MVVGLTGRYCAGKSTAAAYLAQQGWLHLDVDRIGHRVLDQQAAAAAGLFGDQVLCPDGTVDRQELGRLVFNDPQQLARLEALLHPLMAAEVSRHIAEHPGVDVLVDAALLFRMGLHLLCDRILWLNAPVLVRFLRGRTRDGISLQGFFRRNRAQLHIVAQARSGGADILSVSNWGSRRWLYRRLDTLLQR
ncbi:dephospho-CoA kinase [Spirochaeta africana]|uniref:Dephospho-CoA kinase n=1 Tax=Spirochaeta africana (strain ATCC 700263 / DSM 8902 / Z-7692) TaxID=889378 RepID=H9UMJ7_SPIAZ|nr:dephospho-CoA kinase [Spirochaeta africana]AFG38740.1 dephospho-CoA kinase [Spirochaeta africana DSM 8902]